MVSYPYYEICQGCEEFLLGDNGSVLEIAVNFPMKKVREIRVYCHECCDERAIERLKKLLGSEEYASFEIIKE